MEAPREPDSCLTDTLDEISKICKLWLLNRKVGSVQFNFFKGGLSSYKIEETKKLHNKE
jgi:hypothetical protein